MLTHLSHYLILLALFALVVLIKLFSAPDNNLLIRLLWLAAFLYVIWGIIHHLLEHDLTVKIVIEYILIAAVAMLISLIALKGGILG